MNGDQDIRNCHHHFAPPGEEEVFALAERKMELEKRYLDHALTMESLAAEMGVHRNALSHAVNKFAGEGFPSWLAGYRVAEAERLASLPEGPRRRLSDLAREAGFPNHVSLYRAFVRLRHATPSALLGKHTCESGARGRRESRK